jgi:hypothetical protein
MLTGWWVEPNTAIRGQFCPDGWREHFELKDETVGRGRGGAQSSRRREELSGGKASGQAQHRALRRDLSYRMTAAGGALARPSRAKQFGPTRIVGLNSVYGDGGESEQQIPRVAPKRDARNGSESLRSGATRGVAPGPFGRSQGKH